MGMATRRPNEATIPRLMNALDTTSLRAQFPGLDTPWALLDNAGGTVPCQQVLDRVQAYLTGPMVQHGATYELSTRATALVEEGRAAMATLMGAGVQDVALGSSTTSLLSRLARALAPGLGPGDEVVVTNLDHETNVGCWRRIAEARGATVREWRFDPITLGLELAGLEEVLNGRTKLVAFGHVSNLIGQIHDVPALCGRIRESGALSVVDGVALAPHRRPDVRQLGADAYVFSTYKVFGPHQAVLWVRPGIELESVNHFFVEGRRGGLEPGGVVHELAAGLPGIVEYLEMLGDGADTDARLEDAYARIAAHEAELVAPLLAFLSEQPGVTVRGPATAEAAVRVPTVSFTVDGTRASAIPSVLDEHQVAIRWGHFYAYRPMQELGLLEADGVVRVSMVHTTSSEEVSRLVAGLEAALSVVRG
jgi:cysteine desulfurase family protein (TIGR01976 family)